MGKVKSALKAVSMTFWFAKTSWGYITTKRIGSKIEFITGFIPAWFRFTIATYKDCRLAQ